jgi:hypothetical protein
MVTEHFRVWLEEYFLQPLKGDPRQKTGRSDRRTTYPISFVQCLGHNVLIVCDEAIKAEQTQSFLWRNTTHCFNAREGF